ncbi:MAG: V-type ATP synthase subunit F [Defluviitaleaceae bacterium]|nr:V-type ATP synthase subunit F [Defluviitaleaceae bacterium]
MAIAGEYKLYAISDDPHILTGLALAGVAGMPAHTPDELHQALVGISPDIGVVIVSSGLAAKSADIIEKYREKNTMPLITIVPEMSDIK